MRDLGQEIKRRRNARKWPQKMLAHQLGISQRTLRSLENSGYQPKPSLQGELIRVLGFTTTEMSRLCSLGNYRLSGHDYVERQHNGSYVAFANELIKFDKKTIVPASLSSATAEDALPEEFTGIPGDRASNLRDHQGNWCVQTFQDELVGYWEFYVLDDEHFERIRRGELKDGEVTNNMLVPLWRPGRYNMYFNVVTTEEGDHRKEEPILNLIGAIGERLFYLAKRGIFFSKICADAFTTRGAKLCEFMGFKLEAENQSAPDGFSAKIYYLSGSNIAKGHFKENTALIEAYQIEFRLDGK